MDYEILVDRINKVPEQLDMELVELETSVLPVVNKDRKIILEKLTAENWIKLVAAAKKAGFDFDIGNGYRTNEYQQEILNYYIDKLGFDVAIMRVAIPGYSEHQTGLAIDFDYFRMVETDGKVERKIVAVVEENHPEIQWMLNNMADYGFILRYPKHKVKITGYGYEPWHIRYVGEELAHYLSANDLTLDEHHRQKNKLIK